MTQLLPYHEIEAARAWCDYEIEAARAWCEPALKYGSSREALEAFAAGIVGHDYWPPSTDKKQNDGINLAEAIRRLHHVAMRPANAERRARVLKRAERVERVLSDTAVAILGLPLRTVQQLAARGELGAAKLGRRWTFDLERLRRLVKQRERETWQNAKPQPDVFGAAKLSGVGLRSVAGIGDGRFTQVTRRLRARATKSGESG